MRKSEKWQIIGKSVRGASHIRKNLPNQDAIQWDAGSESGLPLILAVSDGHGSEKCFRSDRGSCFAVDVAVKTLGVFIKRQAKITNLTTIKRIAEEQLPKEIIKRWEDKVEEDIGEAYNKCRRNLGNPQGLTETAYGATLLTVLITESFIIYMQLGDGDILVVSKDGEIQRPVPKDDRLFGNETTSLCTKNSWRDFRFYFQPILDKPPRLILMATDGYANSFRDDENFFKVAGDIHEMIQTNGPEFVENHLENWLNEASERGSGDDITVGIMFYS